MVKYVISEKFHCWMHWEYWSFDEALNELKRKAKLPLGDNENQCPCTSWKTCSMLYEIRWYEKSDMVLSEDIVEISSTWIEWIYKK